MMRGEPAAVFVGASLLAKNLNDNACFLNKRGAYEFFASKLAPTVSGHYLVS
ncbi:hypothetical protein SAMN05216202_4244 [Pseudomonas mucidolens]|uniref:Uncharacterized protein n=1 Tax=Pseudomonas mucidolens TaxID=46679 RepID=A0A1H2NNS4_9PSED|nr:hypothetical protein SAMN05216202_4244 [Pseudomonas mucidolens]SQH31444.1 Uncharacterised protein [Pseudomonas mucidolens]